MTYRLDVRAEVAAFALLMEAKLRENDHKGGWKRDKALGLLSRLYEETNELAARLRLREWSVVQYPYASEVGREAADVANFAMMLADVCGALVLPPAEEKSEPTPADSAEGCQFLPSPIHLTMCGRCGQHRDRHPKEGA